MSVSESMAEEAFDAPEEEGVLTRFHGHHHNKVSAPYPFVLPLVCHTC